jgi:phage-related holin
LVIPEPTWERLNELLDIAQKLKEEGIPIPDSYQSLIQTAKAAKII